MNHAIYEAIAHAATAALIAPIVGLALAALIDWLSHSQKHAVVSEMSHRCIEGVLGGAIEGFLVSLVIIAVSHTA
jgi:hypothetical protein